MNMNNQHEKERFNIEMKNSNQCIDKITDKNYILKQQNTELTNNNNLLREKIDTQMHSVDHMLM